MAKTPLDLEKVRVELNGLTRDELLSLAEDAIERIPAARREEWLGQVVKLEKVRKAPATKDALVAEVKRFCDATAKREYFEDFRIDSRTYRNKSNGTQRWEAEARRLFGKCVSSAANLPAEQTSEAIGALLELFEKVDDDPDSFVFWADEGGSWQAYIDFELVLPVWFQALTSTAAPKVFAERVRWAIQKFAHHKKVVLLAAAQKVATVEQLAVLAKT